MGTGPARSNQLSARAKGYLGTYDS
jgi:hypothetical protein